MNPLDEKFNQLGQALSQCSDLLSTVVSLGGEESYFEKTPPKFSLLTNLDIVLGNVADGYSASSILMELSRSLVRQETAKRLAPSVDEWLDQLNLRINQLNSALAEQNNDGYMTRLGQIRELVLIMREGLTNEVRNIEFSLNTKFGHVESIKDKQLENKYLINRISRLTEKLMLLDYKQLRTLANNNSDLLSLLPTRLHESIEQCRLSLVNSLPRLKHLLWEFEKINKNTQVVWALHHHLRNQSIAYTHVPSHDELTTLKLCSQNEPVHISTHAHICDKRFTNDFIKIVHSMKPKPSGITLPEEVALIDTLYIEEDIQEEATLDAFMEDKLLEFVTLSKFEKSSCLEFWKNNLSVQQYSGGFLQWAHNSLKGISDLNIEVIQNIQSPLSGNMNIIDFTIEYKSAN